MILSSCGDDSNSIDCSVNFSSSPEFQAEINSLSAAAAAYASESSVANCDNYKEALDSYIDLLEEYFNCGGGVADQAALQAQIDQARADADLITC